MIGAGSGNGRAVTEMWAELHTKVEQMQHSTRLGEPRETGEAAVWLASDAAFVVHGHLLMADEGWVIC